MSTLATCMERIGTIHYPPPPMAQPLKCPPISSVHSRSLLAQYKLDTAARRGEDAQNRFRIANTDQGKKGASPEELLAEGRRKLHEENDAEGALEHLLEAISSAKEPNPEAYAAAGDAYFERGLMDDALEMFAKGITANPLQTELYQKKGDCLLMLDNPGDAVDEFEKYLLMEEPPYELLIRVGKACLDADRFERAEELFKQAEEQKPEDAYLAYNFGELYERTGRTDEGLEAYASVMTKDPRFPKPYMDEAAQCLEAENLAGALHLYESLLKVQPNEPSLYIRCVDIYLQLGLEFSINALTCLNQAVKLGEDEDGKTTLDATVFVKRGVLLFDQFGEPKGGIADFTTAIEIDLPLAEKGQPTSAFASAHEYRAACCRQLGTEEGLAMAAGDYVRFVTLENVDDSRKGIPCVFLGEYYFERNDLISAAKYYTQAYTSHVDYPLNQERVILSLLAAKTQPPKPPSAPESEKGEGREGEGEEGGKDEPPNSARHSEPPPPSTPQSALAVGALWQLACASHYKEKRSQEPTCHSELTYRFLGIWGPFAKDLSARREEEMKERGKKPGGARRK